MSLALAWGAFEGDFRMNRTGYVWLAQPNSKFGLLAGMMAIAACMALTPAHAAPVYSFTTIDDGTSGTLGQGINNAGIVSGFYCTTPSCDTTSAFIYNGSFSDNNFPGAAQTSGAGINNSGMIVGTWIDGNGVHNAYFFDGSSFTTINDPKGASNNAHGINDNNQIVGYYGASTSGPSTGFLYSTVTHTFTDIADPNAGPQGTAATGINNAGNVVGFYTDSLGNSHGFLFDGSTYHMIDDPLGAGGTFAYGINDLGDIVGLYFDASSNAHGFLYDGVDYSTIDDPNGSLWSEIDGINDSGQLTGMYVDASETPQGFIANPVPEPGSLFLLLGGLPGLLALRRRRRRMT